MQPSWARPGEGANRDDHEHRRLLHRGDRVRGVPDDDGALDVRSAWKTKSIKHSHMRFADLWERRGRRHIRQ